MKQLIRLVAALMLSGWFSASPSRSDDALKSSVQVHMTAAGSGGNLGITRLLTEAFSKEHPEIFIDIPGSIGSAGAVKAVTDGAITLGLISRPLQEAEKAKGLTVQPYAQTAVVIGAHPSVPDDTITTQELIDIFKGVKTQWKDGNTIIVQSREKFDSGFIILGHHVPGFKEVYIESLAAKRWTLNFTDQDANRALSTTPYAIGVTDMGMIATERLNVKILKYNGMTPNSETVLNGTYPLVRQLSFLFRPDTLPDEAKVFLRFVTSDAARSILKANSYIPLP